METLRIAAKIADIDEREEKLAEIDNWFYIYIIYKL